MDGWYAYGVRKCTGGGAIPQRAGLRRGAPVSLAVVPYRDIEAVVARVPLGDFAGEMGRKRWEDEGWLKTQVLAHEQVVEEVMRQSPPVIPFKFATIFRSRSRLTAMLQSNHSRFQKLLRRFEHRVEWGVKLFSHAEALARVSAGSDHRVRQLRAAMRGAPAGKAYFIGKELGAHLLGGVRRQQEQIARTFLEVVQPYADQLIANEPLPRTLTGRNDEMLGNFALLVAGERVDSLRNALERWNRTYQKRGVIAEDTGPWPPYHFVTL